MLQCVMTGNHIAGSPDVDAFGEWRLEAAALMEHDDRKRAEHHISSFCGSTHGLENERTNEVSFTLRRKEMKIMNKTIVSFVDGLESNHKTNGT